MRFVLPAGIFRPVRGTGRRVDAHDAVRTDAEVAQCFANRARLFHLREKALAIVVASHRRSSARRRPHGRHERSDHEPACADAIGEPLQRVAIGVDVDVRVEEKEIDPVEAYAADFCCRGQVEHRVEIDRRFRVGSLPTSPGHIALCSAGLVCVFIKNFSASLRLCVTWTVIVDCPDYPVRNASG